MGKSGVSNEATSSKSTEELRQKLDELRESRKVTARGHPLRLPYKMGTNERGGDKIRRS